ncbi:MAG: hypothetical protein AB7V45_04265 [Candidatus Krumholzibacteriia bacterium]
MDSTGRSFVGVWIDHEQAHIVNPATDQVSVRTLVSGIGKRLVRPASGPPPKGAEGNLPAADGNLPAPGQVQRDRRYSNQLLRFYRRVAAALQGSDRIYICGPGEAKLEFRRVLELSPGMADRIIGVEAADMMTERRLCAHIRTLFLKKPVVHR